MVFMDHHLISLAVLVISLSVASPRNIKPTNGKKRYQSEALRQVPLKDHVLPLRYAFLKPNDSLQHSYVRKSSDQFKWPWRNYEEWKKHQEKLENELDQRLKTRGKPSAYALNSISSKGGKTSGRMKLKDNNKNLRRKLKRRRRKKKLSNRLSKVQNGIAKKGEKSASPVAYNVSSTGGAVLAVKYYSTDEESPAEVTEKSSSTTAIEVVTTENQQFQQETTTTTDRSEALLRLRMFLQPNYNSLFDGCTVNNGGCEGLCVRKKNTHYCHCPEGFRLDFTRKKCIDTNECLTRNGHGPCQGECVNLWGSYKCGCHSIPGTRLDVDARTCAVVDQCASVRCSHICVNTRSGAFCSCPDGFVLDADWTTCKPLGADEN